MNKEKLIELLNEHKGKLIQYELKENEKKRLEIRLTELEKVKYDVKITPTYEEGGKGNSIDSKVERQVIKYEDKTNRLKSQIAQIEKEMAELKCDLDEVNIRLKALNKLERGLIEAYYIEGESYENIGITTFYRLTQERKGIGETRDRKTIKRKLEQIVDKLADF